MKWINMIERDRGEGKGEWKIATEIEERIIQPAETNGHIN